MTSLTMLFLRCLSLSHMLLCQPLTTMSHLLESLVHISDNPTHRAFSSLLEDTMSPAGRDSLEDKLMIANWVVDKVKNHSKADEVKIQEKAGKVVRQNSAVAVGAAEEAQTLEASWWGAEVTFQEKTDKVMSQENEGDMRNQQKTDEAQGASLLAAEAMTKEADTVAFQQLADRALTQVWEGHWIEEAKTQEFGATWFGVVPQDKADMATSQDKADRVTVSEAEGAMTQEAEVAGETTREQADKVMTLAWAIQWADDALDLMNTDRMKAQEKPDGWASQDWMDKVMN
eukprot:gnl/MRDRNA2_/MRDRNA2_73774_c0_seq1.p3 gnl/MRDRNA2_/MRDRNA2_73774_c0~~gnl/MRDRNA2_/MRDRNA2_73774_c0_seq1.p3  ORF type:complete len:287 (-),score=69.57 gnl/MRDRNA2_/MRDRNA2_73774_c0_seq1:720-1580(-)